jgi:hypothetical protein
MCGASDHCPRLVFARDQSRCEESNEHGEGCLLHYEESWVVGRGFFRYWKDVHGPIGARIPRLRRLVQSHRRFPETLASRISMVWRSFGSTA